MLSSCCVSHSSVFLYLFRLLKNKSSSSSNCSSSLKSSTSKSSRPSSSNNSSRGGSRSGSLTRSDLSFPTSCNNSNSSSSNSSSSADPSRSGCWQPQPCGSSRGCCTAWPSCGGEKRSSSSSVAAGRHRCWRRYSSAQGSACSCGSRLLWGSSSWVPSHRSSSSWLWSSIDERRGSTTSSRSSGSIAAESASTLSSSWQSCASTSKGSGCSSSSNITCSWTVSFHSKGTTCSSSRSGPRCASSGRGNSCLKSRRSTRGYAGGSSSCSLKSSRSSCSSGGRIPCGGSSSSQTCASATFHRECGVLGVSSACRSSRRNLSSRQRAGGSNSSSSSGDSGSSSREHRGSTGESSGLSKRIEDKVGLQLLRRRQLQQQSRQVAHGKAGAAVSAAWLSAAATQQQAATTRGAAATGRSARGGGAPHQRRGTAAEVSALAAPAGARAAGNDAVAPRGRAAAAAAPAAAAGAAGAAAGAAGVVEGSAEDVVWGRFAFYVERLNATHAAAASSFTSAAAAAYPPPRAAAGLTASSAASTTAAGRAAAARDAVAAGGLHTRNARRPVDLLQQESNSQSQLLLHRLSRRELLQLLVFLEKQRPLLQSCCTAFRSELLLHHPLTLLCVRSIGCWRQSLPPHALQQALGFLLSLTSSSSGSSSGSSSSGSSAVSNSGSDRRTSSSSSSLSPGLERSKRRWEGEWSNTADFEKTEGKETWPLLQLLTGQLLLLCPKPPVGKQLLLLAELAQHPATAALQQQPLWEQLLLFSLGDGPTVSETLILSYLYRAASAGPAAAAAAAPMHTHRLLQTRDLLSVAVADSSAPPSAAVDHGDVVSGSAAAAAVAAAAARAAALARAETAAAAAAISSVAVSPPAADAMVGTALQRHLVPDWLYSASPHAVAVLLLLLCRMQSLEAGTFAAAAEALLHSYDFISDALLLPLLHVLLICRRFFDLRSARPLAAPFPHRDEAAAAAAAGFPLPMSSSAAADDSRSTCSSSSSLLYADSLSSRRGRDPSVYSSSDTSTCQNSSDESSDRYNSSSNSSSGLYSGHRFNSSSFRSDNSSSSLYNGDDSSRWEKSEAEHPLYEQRAKRLLAALRFRVQQRLGRVAAEVSVAEVEALLLVYKPNKLLKEEFLKLCMHRQLLQRLQPTSFIAALRICARLGVGHGSAARFAVAAALPRQLPCMQEQHLLLLVGAAAGDPVFCAAAAARAAAATPAAAAALAWEGSCSTMRCIDTLRAAICAEKKARAAVVVAFTRASLHICLALLDWQQQQQKQLQLQHHFRRRLHELQYTLPHTFDGLPWGLQQLLSPSCSSNVRSNSSSKTDSTMTSSSNVSSKSGMTATRASLHEGSSIVRGSDEENRSNFLPSALTAGGFDDDTAAASAAAATRMQRAAAAPASAWLLPLVSLLSCWEQLSLHRRLARPLPLVLLLSILCVSRPPPAHPSLGSGSSNLTTSSSRSCLSNSIITRSSGNRSAAAKEEEEGESGGGTRGRACSSRSDSSRIRSSSRRIEEAWLDAEEGSGSTAAGTGGTAAMAAFGARGSRVVTAADPLLRLSMPQLLVLVNACRKSGLLLPERLAAAVLQRFRSSGGLLSPAGAADIVYTLGLQQLLLPNPLQQQLLPAAHGEIRCSGAIVGAAVVSAAAAVAGTPHMEVAAAVTPAERGPAWAALSARRPTAQASLSARGSAAGLLLPAAEPPTASAAAALLTPLAAAPARPARAGAAALRAAAPSATAPAAASPSVYQQLSDSICEALWDERLQQPTAEQLIRFLWGLAAGQQWGWVDKLAVPIIEFSVKQYHELREGPVAVKLLLLEALLQIRRARPHLALQLFTRTAARPQEASDPVLDAMLQQQQQNASVPASSPCESPLRVPLPCSSSNSQRSSSIEGERTDSSSGTGSRKKSSSRGADSSCSSQRGLQQFTPHDSSRGAVVVAGLVPAAAAAGAATAAASCATEGGRIVADAAAKSFAAAEEKEEEGAGEQGEEKENVQLPQVSTCGSGHAMYLPYCEDRGPGSASEAATPRSANAATAAERAAAAAAVIPPAAEGRQAAPLSTAAAHTTLATGESRAGAAAAGPEMAPPPAADSVAAAALPYWRAGAAAGAAPAGGATEEGGATEAFPKRREEARCSGSYAGTKRAEGSDEGACDAYYSMRVAALHTTGGIVNAVLRDTVLGDLQMCWRSTRRARQKDEETHSALGRLLRRLTVSSILQRQWPRLLRAVQQQRRQLRHETTDLEKRADDLMWGAATGAAADGGGYLFEEYLQEEEEYCVDWGIAGWRLGVLLLSASNAPEVPVQQQHQQPTVHRHPVALLKELLLLSAEPAQEHRETQQHRGAVDRAAGNGGRQTRERYLGLLETPKNVQQEREQLLLLLQQQPDVWGVLQQHLLQQSLVPHQQHQRDQETAAATRFCNRGGTSVVLLTEKADHKPGALAVLHPPPQAAPAAPAAAAPPVSAAAADGGRWAPALARDESAADNWTGAADATQQALVLSAHAALRVKYLQDVGRWRLVLLEKEEVKQRLQFRGGTWIDQRLQESRQLLPVSASLAALLQRPSSTWTPSEIRKLRTEVFLHLQKELLFLFAF